MLVFNKFILDTIKELKINDSKELLNTFEEKDKIVKDFKNKVYKEEPGSIHFNISISDIEKINKIKFYLLLRESGIISEWGKERNKYVKDIGKLVDVFGPFILDVKLNDIEKK